MSVEPQAKIHTPLTAGPGPMPSRKHSVLGITRPRPDAIAAANARPSESASVAGISGGSMSLERAMTPVGYQDRYLTPLLYEAVSPNGPSTIVAETSCAPSGAVILT